LQAAEESLCGRPPSPFILSPRRGNHRWAIPVFRCSFWVGRIWSAPAGRERRRRFWADERFNGCGRFACVRKRCRAALATAVQNLTEIWSGPANAKRLGVRWHDIAFLNATCRVGPKRGHVRALQSHIPNAAGATGRGACPVKYGGDNGKPWRRRYFTGRGARGWAMTEIGCRRTGIHFLNSLWGGRLGRELSQLAAGGMTQDGRDNSDAGWFGDVLRLGVSRAPGQASGATPKTATGTVALPIPMWSAMA
jgi:hypothetical protein